MDSILEFNVSNQIIARADKFEVVADSRNYLYAHFNFLTDEWIDNGTATAIFQNNGQAYNQILDTENKCLVPYECLETDDRYILVSVFCGDRIIANMAKVFVAESGWTDDMEAANPPTPSVYAQIIHRMDDVEDAVEEARDRAETAADKAEAAVEHYPRIIDDYWYVWDVENEEFVNTNVKAEAQDGTSATVSVVPIPDGHRVIITDVSGEHVFDVPDGYDGRGIESIQKTASAGNVDTYTMTFTDGTTFTYQITNGASATITSTTITGGHRLTITDKNGTQTVDVMDGARGATGVGIHSIVKTSTYQNIDYYTITYTNGNKTTFAVTNGYSPTVSVTTISGGHRVTITDVNGTHSFDVMDGTAGGTAIHICTSSEYDPITRVPTVQNPQEDVFYLVPAVDGESHDMFVEWIYANSAWEMFGSASIDLSQYATKTELNGKVDKVTGKGLSTNDYTTAEKTKLNGIAEGAEANVQADWNQTNTVADDYIKNKPSIPSPITVDDALSTTSENPVQNKVITGTVNQLNEDITELSGSIAPVESSTTATAAHAVGELFLVGETLMVALSAIAVGDTITTEGSTPNAAVTKLTDKLLKDVQVNGTSVITDGVANVPVATGNSVGVVYASGNGLTLQPGGRVVTQRATDTEVKASANGYKPIVPLTQDASTFYGLAKAASDTTQSASSNPVGTYTDAAKVAIQKMLGIYEPPWELLNDITLDAEGGIDLTADSNGTPYNLLGVYIYVYYAPNLIAATTGYGRYRLYDSNGRYCNSETGAYTASSNQKYKYVLLDRRNNLAFLNYTIAVATGNNSAWYVKYPGNTTLELANGGAALNLGNIVRIALAGTDVEPAGTRIQIYGQRAY